MEESQDLSKVDLNALVLIAKDQASDGPAITEIVRRFQPVTKAIAARVTSVKSFHDDLSQAAFVGLLAAVRHHDPARQHFSEYARLYMIGAARRELRFLLKLDVASISDPEVWEAVMGKPSPSCSAGMFCWGHGTAARALKRLSDRQQRLLDQRYIADASLEAIAIGSGTTVSAVSQRLATAHKALLAAIAA